MHPFSSRPSYRAIASLPLPELVARLRDAALRSRILNEADESPHVFMQFFGKRFDRFFPLADPPDYLPSPEQSVAAQAQRAGRAPEDVLYDALLADEGRAFVYIPITNYVPGKDRMIEQMLRHAYTLPALGDGGAHVATIVDSSASTFLLTEWVRRRGAFSLQQGVHMLTGRPASIFGFEDRGVLAPGLKADINVIEFDRLAIERPQMHYDLPAGGKRLLQGARGYRATIVNGEITYQDGEATASLPGRLVRRH
jgi:N-acyl-D-aspartate/D-glutamate deacylase